MKRKLESQLRTDAAKNFYQALASLDKLDDVADFLRDVLTLEEMDEAIRRFEVARMLVEGITVREIAKKTKMSSATISRINYWLHHGTGGYGLALEKIK